MRAICEAEDMPDERTVRTWAMDKENPFSPQYTRAREIGYRRMADEILEIADDGRNDSYLDDDGNVRVNQDVIARSRLRFDARRWLLSKALPKIYGDKLAIGGDEENPFRHIHEIKLTIVDPKLP